ncbi:MAG: LysE family translocator [Sneathiella sp.]
MTFLFAMSIFALTMSISPGPVNIVTFSSGATNGILKTVPFVLGATAGFTLLLFVLGLGIARTLESYPEVLYILGKLGGLFIVYMAYKTIKSDASVTFEARKTPKLVEGAMLQWLNPKAWIACLSGVTAFTVEGDISSLVLFCAVYFILCFFGVGFWAIVGSQAKRFLNTSKRSRLFNGGMGGCLGCVGLYILFF